MNADYIPANGKLRGLVGGPEELNEAAIDRSYTLCNLITAAAARMTARALTDPAVTANA